MGWRGGCGGGPHEKASSSFFEKKEPKKLFLFRVWGCGGGEARKSWMLGCAGHDGKLARAPRNKSFLQSFFSKKRPLALPD
jgi:hypothetical protein